MQQEKGKDVKASGFDPKGSMVLTPAKAKAKEYELLKKRMKKKKYCKLCYFLLCVRDEGLGKTC